MSHEQVAVTFKDLTYSVELGKKQGTKVILDGISGCFKPGPVSYTHLRAHETTLHLVCRLLLEKKKN